MFNKSRSVFSRFSLVFATISLAACGGGGSSGGGSDPVPVASGTVTTAVKPGIFISTISPGSGAADQEARTLVSPTGKYAIFTGGLTGMFGTLTFPTDDTFSDGNAAYRYFDGSWQSEDGSLDGSASSLEEFSATFTPDAAGSDLGSVVAGMRFNEVSDRRLTLQDIDGTYFLSGTNPTSVTVAPDGTVTGSDTDNSCVFNGDINIPDPAYNIFEGNLLLSNCSDIQGVSGADRNGDYPVVGYSLRSSQGDKVLVFAGTNGKTIFTFSGSN